MVRELILLRHGKSDWATETDDFHRPLKDRGKRGAQKIGLWLAQNNQVPDYVLSSPAERAITTAEKACKVMGFNTQKLAQDERVYLATPETLMDVIKSCPGEINRLMVVGHNPGMEMLLSLLTDQPLDIPEDGKLLPTATLAIFRINTTWQDLSANQSPLLTLLRARNLADKFPFPELNSNELRDRPAYYYYQSSVIPYRVHKGEMEVLIIASSSGAHWVFPKGIIDPGLSPQQSAAKEALEEAGVKGRVDDKLLGEYYADKWGAQCHVLVYPMEVTQIIPENKRQEKHRSRKWLSIEQAAQYIENTELLNMLERLSTRLCKG